MVEVRLDIVNDHVQHLFAICQYILLNSAKFLTDLFIWTPFWFISVLESTAYLKFTKSQYVSLAFVAGWLQGHWWGFISRNYVVWPTFFLMNVFIALKGSHFWFLSVFRENGRITAKILTGWLKPVLIYTWNPRPGLCYGSSTNKLFGPREGLLIHQCIKTANI